MSRKTGMNKVEQALLKKHVAAGTSEIKILKVFKDVKAEVVKGFIVAFSEKPAVEKPAAKKPAAKKPAAKKEEVKKDEDDDDIV